MTQLFVLISILVIIYQSAAVAQSTCDKSAIDEEIVKEVDLTGDGKPDKISIHIMAKDMRSPFVWELHVEAHGKRIYSHSSDDAWFDEFFNDNGYVAGCTGYVECKKQYYFYDLPKGVVLSDNGGYDLDGVLDKNQENTLYPVGRRELKECCNVAGEEAATILANIEGRFRQERAVVLLVPQSPVHDNPPLVFAPEVGRFIRFYEE